MTLDKLTSAIYNNITTGLKGADINHSFTLDQIEDEIIQERMQIIKEYSMKNLVPLKDLMYSIPCVHVDCEDLDRCPRTSFNVRPTKHIEIPQVYNDLAADSVNYIGSTDRMYPYRVYTDNAFRQHQFKRRGANDPFVWIDTTPNRNNMNDAFIFNANPMLTELLVVLIPKDIRQLDEYGCCGDVELSNFSFIDTEIEKRVTEKFIRWYRQIAAQLAPNDQSIKI